MLPKSARLTVSDIETLATGKSAFGALISLRYRASSTLKFSVSVSKKVAKTAVMRNRIRRRIYAVLENVHSEVKRPFFIMLMPKKDCLTAPRDILMRDILSLITKIS